MRIFDQLERLVEEAKSADIVQRIIVGGSFVTAKAEPNDFDCILVLDPEIVGATLRPFEYNLVSRRMARCLFGGDVLSALQDSDALQQYLDFSQTTRDALRMGIVEVL